MSIYKNISLMTTDREFLSRVAACAAIEVPRPYPGWDPLGWAYEHSWNLAARPGWAEVYSPLDHGDGVTDEMILEGIREEIQKDAASADPTPTDPQPEVPTDPEGQTDGNIIDPGAE